jgi:serine/threonine protein kinase
MSEHIPTTDLRAYARGELDSTPRYAEIGAHLHDCPECSDALESIEAALKQERPPVVVAPLSLHTAVVNIGRQRFFPPESFGHYEVFALLGGGSEGEVYAAWNNREDRYEALKFARLARPQGPIDPAATIPLPAAPPDLAREARAAVRFQGPHFITVYGLGQVEGEWFLAMELATGRKLEGWRGAGASRVVGWLAPVADDLDTFHANGLPHGDVKPGNVLLVDPNPPRPGEGCAPQMPEPCEPSRLTARLADFGLVDRQGLRGTAGYAAPEQFDPRLDLITGDRTRRAGAIDGFGLAATVCAMITSRRHETPTEAAKRGRSQGDDAGYAHGAKPGVEYAAPDVADLVAFGVDRDLATVLAKQLAADPRRRYESVAAFAADLRRWLAGEPVEARRDRWRFARQLRWAYRKQERWVRIGFPLLFALLAAVAVGLWRVDEQKVRERAERLGRERDVAVLDARRAVAESQAADARAQAAEKQAQITTLETRLEVDLANQRAAAAEAEFVVKQTAAARAAAGQGDWPTALRFFGEVIPKADPATARRLRVERLTGYFAVNDLAGLDRELSSLERGELGTLRAQVSLVRGMYCLCHAGREREGREGLTRALCEAEHLFTPADALYAEALNEPSPRAVIDKLNLVTQKYPRHYPAQMSLTFALLADGQPAAADEQCARVEGWFPGAHAPLIARAQTAALRGDRAAMRASLAAFAERTGTDTALLARHCEQFADALDLLAGGKHPLTPINPSELGAVAGKVFAMNKLAVEKGPLALADPAASFFFVWPGELVTLALRVMRNPLDPDVAGELERACAGSRESYYRTLAAFVHMLRAAVAIQAGDTPKAIEALECAADYAHAAAEAESLVTRGPMRYLMLGFGACMDAYVLKLDPSPRPAQLRRLARTLPRLTAEGGGWPGAQLACVYVVAEALREEVSPAFVELWQIDAAAGARARWERLRHLSHLAQPLLAACAPRRLAPAACGHLPRAAAAAAALGLTIRDRRLVELWTANLGRWARGAGLDRNSPPPPQAPMPRPK